MYSKEKLGFKLGVLAEVSTLLISMEEEGIFSTAIKQFLSVGQWCSAWVTLPVGRQMFLTDTHDQCMGNWVIIG